MRTTRSIRIGAAASLALMAGALAAQPGGNGKNNGQDNGNKGAAHAGPAKPTGAKPAGNPGKADKPAPQNQKPAKKEQARSNPPAAKPQAAPPGQARADRPAASKKPSPAIAQKPKDAAKGKTAPVARAQRTDIRRETFNGPKGRKITVPTNDRVRVVTTRRDFDWASLNTRKTFDGCPPGLAKKYNGCTPPGLDREPTTAWARPNWYLGNYDRSLRYRYADGYLLRLGAGTDVLGYLPLLGGALSVGQRWPATYQPIDLPGYYNSYYGLGSPSGYRYYDDTIYRVDPDTAAIQAIAALLTGNDIPIGQPMPAGYDVYNVPYGYRDQYVDGPDALYRYSDGYVYQLDPTTRLVQAAIELLS